MSKKIKQTVLITGGSKGIGRACARVFAKKGYTIVLTARNKEELGFVKKKVEQKYDVKVTVIPIDLSKADAAVLLQEKLEKKKINVDVLVNSAGFGDFCNFFDSNWDKQKNMIDVNITALMQMTYIFGKTMRERGSGSIVNLASAAALSPGPYMATYYATKAFVLSFSQAVAKELEGTGVTVTAICPGPTKTGFEETANMENSNMFVAIKPAFAIDVAKTIYEAVEDGKVVKYHGMPTKLINIGTRFAPRYITRIVAKKINGKKSSEKNHKM